MGQLHEIEEWHVNQNPIINMPTILQYKDRPNLYNFNYEIKDMTYAKLAEMMAKWDFPRDLGYRGLAADRAFEIRQIIRHFTGIQKLNMIVSEIDKNKYGLLERFYFRYQKGTPVYNAIGVWNEDVYNIDRVSCRRDIFDFDDMGKLNEEKIDKIINVLKKMGREKMAVMVGSTYSRSMSEEEYNLILRPKLCEKILDNFNVIEYQPCKYTPGSSGSGYPMKVELFILKQLTEIVETKGKQEVLHENELWVTIRQIYNMAKGTWKYNYLHQIIHNNEKIRSLNPYGMRNKGVNYSQGYYNKEDVIDFLQKKLDKKPRNKITLRAQMEFVEKLNKKIEEVNKMKHINDTALNHNGKEFVTATYLQKRKEGLSKDTIYQRLKRHKVDSTKIPKSELKGEVEFMEGGVNYVVFFDKEEAEKILSNYKPRKNKAAKSKSPSKKGRNAALKAHNTMRTNSLEEANKELINVFKELDVDSQKIMLKLAKKLVEASKIMKVSNKITEVKQLLDDI